MDATRPIDRCATAGCSSTVLTNGSKHCLKHNTLITRNVLGPGSSSSSFNSNQTPHLVNETQGISRNPRATERLNGGQSHNGLSSSHGETSSLSDPKQTVRNTNFPPDLLHKHAITAKKSIARPSVQRTHPSSVSPTMGSAARFKEHTRSRFMPPTSRSPDKFPSGKAVQNGGQSAKSTTTNGQDQRKAPKISSAADKVAPPARAASQNPRQTSQASSQSTANHGVNKPRPEASRQRSKSKEPAKSLTPSAASPGRIDYRSLPIVRSGLQPPPTSIKTAPPFPQPRTSSAKRKRVSISDTASSSTSDSDSDDTREDASFTTKNPNTHDFVPDRSGPSMFASDNPFVLNRRGETIRGPSEGSEDAGINGLPINATQNHSTGLMGRRPNLAIQSQQVLSASTEQWRTRPPASRKLTCEQQRVELCRTVDQHKFDAMIYTQPEAAPPPPEVFITPAPTRSNSTSAGEESHKPFYMRIDPRIHWSHDRSDEWFEQKMEEIKARGGRKANFGKAAYRMRQQRLAEERYEAEQAIARALAARRGKDPPKPPPNPPMPWSHRRPMDFGDVPVEELPSYVRRNEDWLRATEWMRKSRDLSLKAAALEAAGEPWEHLFKRNRNGQ
ncbi:hypothetical protein CcaCcLH18_11186 [Colletotrichum camelliae]|nr:hypothetical protein CcaCcLH18_11186 [Colletotrichum camelliae]